MDLLSDNLDAVSLVDIESFLSIKLPENDRLPEGTKIDYKEHLPAIIYLTNQAISDTLVSGDRHETENSSSRNPALQR